MSVLFISGIDTDIGKTVVTGLMARNLRKSGHNAITLKLVQTGNIGRSEDIEEHRAIMETPPFPEDIEGITAPQVFSFPGSPHLSSKIDNRPLDLDAIRTAVRTLEKRYDPVLVEGAGGLAVPLTEDLLSVDFVAAEQWDMVLVTSCRLGSINHTILSIEAAVRRGIVIRGVICNFHPEPDPLMGEDTPRMIEHTLQRYGQTPLVISVGEVRAPYPDISFEDLLSPPKSQAVKP